VASAILADFGMGMDDPRWLAEWSERVATSFLEHGSVWTFDHHLAASPLVEGLARRRARAVAGMREIVAGQKAHAMAYTLREVLAGRPTVHSLEPRLQAVQRPVLVLWGAEDRLVEGPSRFLAATIPGARSVVVAGASHVTNIQAPAEFNRALAGFLDDLPQARREGEVPNKQ
jgi:pimeloyl-ACP methyl ester carboxylesterase